jgi:predicted branched-subunit amino acid permease
MKQGRSPWREFAQGARDTIPLIIGAIPFGIIFGTLAQGSGFSFGGRSPCRPSCLRGRLSSLPWG